MDEIAERELRPSERRSSGAVRTDWTQRLPLDSAVLAALLLVVAVAGVVLPFAPGLISYDTRVSLIDAQTGAPTDWFTPFGALVWSFFVDTPRGLGTAFVLQTVLVVLALYGLLRLAARRVTSALGAGAICAFPPMYAQLSNLSRDTLFIGFALLAFWLYARGCSSAGHRRSAFLTGAVAAAVVAFLYRQNGVAILFVVLCAVGFEVARSTSWRPRVPKLRRIWPALPVVAAAAMATILVAAATTAVYRVTPVLQTHPERHLFVYDLAALTAATDDNEFPLELRRRPRGVTPQDMSEAGIDRRFDYSTVLALYEPYGMWGTDFTSEDVASEESALLRRAWTSAIREHPLDYVLARARMAASQLGFVRRPTDAFYGIVAPANFDHPIEFTRSYDLAKGYINTFVGPASDLPLDLPWLYFLIATICAFRLHRRSDALGPLALTMTAAVWANLAALGVASIASSFRYTVIAVPVALVLAVYAMSSGRRAEAR